MKIAVIIPTLNEEEALPGTLAAVVRLGFDEVVVVDGGSVDRTVELVRSATPDPSHAAPRPALLTAPAGRASQMNVGAAQSGADVLLFLHADTRLPDGARTEIERALGDSSCVGGRFDVRFERDAGLAWLVARMICLRSRWSGIATGDQALFVRRDAFVRLGGFTEIPIMEDVDFTRRLKRAGRTAALRVPVVTSYRRWAREGAVRTIVLMWTLRFLYWIGVNPHKLKDLYAAVR